MATHFVIGRSSANFRGFFRKIPTCTASACTGPSFETCAITASKIGRSQGGPVEKYSSTLIPGEHACDCEVFPNRRPHSGQVHSAIGHILERLSPPLAFIGHEE